MEQKQNAKQITIEDQIEIIWNDNPRIPFMQSKEILRLGYEKGIDSMSNKLIKGIESKYEELNNTNKTSNKGFIGTSKEVIKYAENESVKRKDNNKSEKTIINASELDIENAKYKLLTELYDYIVENKDLVNIYTKIKNLKINSGKKIKELKK